METVKFYEQVDDRKLSFAVIIAKTAGKWVFCKHKDRETYEVPGGHRESGETILEAARRELNEETGAIEFALKPICAYSVMSNTSEDDSGESFGMLYYAEIASFGEFHSEIEKLLITDVLATDWTYPDIQPRLMEEAKRRGFI